VYQVLKLIRRELIGALSRESQDKALREQTLKLVENQFKICGGGKDKQIESANIHSLVRLCGHNLTKQETYLLMKKSLSQGDTVQYKKFCDSLTYSVNDVQVDAYILTHHLLEAYFGNQQKVNFEKLKGFFAHFSSYFEGDDFEMFLEEVSYLRRGTADIDITELSSMIRNDVELLYK
jgi:hypothetical protein